MKLRQFNHQGKQHGYVDNQRAGLDDRFEIVRRPYSDYQNRRRYDDDYHRNADWVRF